MIPFPVLSIMALGSIPRESGDDPDADQCDALCYGVFPARAGMIRLRGSPILAASRIPRESGDDPDSGPGVCGGSQYSPRERG